jgi:hypothetical protein
VIASRPDWLAGRKKFPLEVTPQAALLGPGWDQGNRLQVAQGDGIATASHRGREENLFLDVGRQLDQARYLAYAGAADVAQAGKAGVVADRAVADQTLELARQGQEAGQTGNATLPAEGAKIMLSRQASNRFCLQHGRYASPEGRSAISIVSQITFLVFRSFRQFEEST